MVMVVVIFFRKLIKELFYKFVVFVFVLVLVYVVLLLL